LSISSLTILSCSELLATILSEAFALSIPNIFSNLFLSFSSEISASSCSLSASALYSSSRTCNNSLLCFYLSYSIIFYDSWRDAFFLIDLFLFLLWFILNPYSALLLFKFYALNEPSLPLWKLIVLYYGWGEDNPP